MVCAETNFLSFLGDDDQYSLSQQLSLPTRLYHYVEQRRDILKLEELITKHPTGKSGVPFSSGRVADYPFVLGDGQVRGFQ